MYCPFGCAWFQQPGIDHICVGDLLSDVVREIEIPGFATLKAGGDAYADSIKRCNRHVHSCSFFQQVLEVGIAKLVFLPRVLSLFKQHIAATVPGKRAEVLLICGEGPSLVVWGKGVQRRKIGPCKDWSQCDAE